MEANGHTPNPKTIYQIKDGTVEEIKLGQSVIKWKAVTGATRYNIIYGPSPQILGVLPNEHSLPARTSPSATLRGIIVGDLYELKVEAYQGTTLIAQSDTIYTYPTDEPLEIITIKDAYTLVADIEILGYLQDIHEPLSHFNYILCDSTLLADNPNTVINEFEAAKEQIEQGIKVWGEVTSGMVTYEQTLESDLEDDDRNNCAEYTEDLLNTDTEDDNDEWGFVYAHTLKDIRIICKSPNTIGCAPVERTVVGRNLGLLAKPKIMIEKNRDVTGSCSEMLHLVAHEAGHVFGLNHSQKSDTVMNSTLCYPTARDIVAMKTIYQSR